MNNNSDLTIQQLYLKSLDILNNQKSYMNKLLENELGQFIHFRNFMLIYRISELNNILEQKIYSIDRDKLSVLSDDELIENILVNIRMAELIRLGIDDAVLAKFNQRDMTPLEALANDKKFSLFYHRLMSHPYRLEDYYLITSDLISDLTKVYSGDLESKILNFDVDSKILSVTNLNESPKSENTDVIKDEEVVDETKKHFENDKGTESQKKELFKKKDNVTSHDLTEVDEIQKELIHIRERAQLINMKSSKVRSFTLFFTNYPVWLLNKFLDHYNGVKNSQGDIQKISEYGKISYSKLILSTVIPLGFGLLGLSTQLLNFTGSSLINAFISGIGMAIFIRNFVFEYLTFKFVRWRINNRINSLNEELSNIVIHSEVSTSYREIGKKIYENKNTGLTSLFDYETLINLHAYFSLDYDPILRYAKAIAEKAVLQSAHSNVSIDQILDDLKYDIYGISAFLALKEGKTNFVQKRHVNLAKQIVLHEINEASQRGKVYSGIRWILSAVIGLITGMFAFLTAKEHIFSKNEDLSVQANKVNQPISGSNDVLKIIVPEQALESYGIVPIDECKTYTKEFVEFLSLNKTGLTNLTFSEIVERFNNQNELLNGRMIESFSTGTKLSTKDLEKLINLFGKDNGEALAYHLHRVMAAKNALQMTDSDPFLREVAESFTSAKQSLDVNNEHEKWTKALQRLREAVNIRANGAFVISKGIEIKKSV
ncbi:MAG: hypothetical protein N3E37_03815 [Candidatus Micrarchaeota archaeon]|nr:hypothetical protein [Candidatus Micrarchaeota archaeon]